MKNRINLSLLMLLAFIASGFSQVAPGITRAAADQRYQLVQVDGLVSGTSVTNAQARANVAAVQRAVGTGGKEVIIPGGKTYMWMAPIGEPIWGACLKLPSRTKIRAFGAVIKAVNNNARALICNSGWTGDESTSTLNTDISIEGGTWDNAQVLASDTTNPVTGTYQTGYIGFAFWFNKVDGLDISNLRAQNSAKFLFTIGNTSNAYFNNLWLESSSDGIHLEGGCDKVYITNIRGKNGDDIIALTPRDYPSTRYAVGDITNVLIRNVIQDGGDKAVVKMIGGVARDGTTQLKVRNVLIDGIYGKQGAASTSGPIVWYEDSGGTLTEGAMDAAGITIRNVRCEITNGSSLIAVSGKRIVDLFLDNCELLYTGSAATKRVFSFGANAVASGTAVWDDITINRPISKSLTAQEAVVNLSRNGTDTFSIGTISITEPIVNGPSAESGSDVRFLCQRNAGVTVGTVKVNNGVLKQSKIWLDSGTIVSQTTEFSITGTDCITNGRPVVLGASTNLRVVGGLFNNGNQGQAYCLINATGLTVNTAFSAMRLTSANSLLGKASSFTGTWTVSTDGAAPLGFADLTLLTPQVGNMICLRANVTAGTMTTISGTTITPGSGSERGIFSWSGAAWVRAY